jgi:hypothetical protein
MATLTFKNEQDLRGNLETFEERYGDMGIKIFVDHVHHTVTIPDESKGYFPHQSYTCSECGGLLYFRKYCGAMVCEKCNAHEGLAHCFCGWRIGGADPEAMYQEQW